MTSGPDDRLLLESRCEAGPEAGFAGREAYCDKDLGTTEPDAGSASD